MSVQQFWNLSQLLGVFTCRKLANLCQNFVTETCKQHSATTRRKLCCEKLVHFWSVLLLKEQMMTSVRKTLKTLVWSAQNRSISSEICPENNHKIRRFFTDCFPAKFAPKIPAKWANFSVILSLKIPLNLTFFRYLSEALVIRPCALKSRCWTWCVGKVNSRDYHFESKKLFVGHMRVVVTKKYIYSEYIYGSQKSSCKSSICHVQFLFTCKTQKCVHPWASSTAFLFLLATMVTLVEMPFQGRKIICSSALCLH